MAVLTPLVPVITIREGAYEFHALAAGRTDHGLDVSITVSNGRDRIEWASIVGLSDEAKRLDGAHQLAQSTKCHAASGNRAFLELLPLVEIQHRETAEPSEWPEDATTPTAALPAFPLHCFAPWLRDMVQATAEALQVPADLPAMLALSILGTALAKKVDVEVRQGYYVPVNCYAMVGMESGERKSPTYRAMLKPLVEYERQLILAAKKENEGRAATKDAPAPLPQLFVDDITTEQVAVVLEQNGERLALFSDEGDSLDIMAGRYSKGTPNFGVYLKGWDGGAYKVNRGMRPSIYLHKPLLSIGLCVQPSVLRGLAETASFRDRGLLGRFWFCLPASYMGRRKPIGTPTPTAVRDAYESHIRRLLEMPLPERAEAISLSHAAHTALVAFAAELEPRLGPDGDLNGCKDWVAKLEGSTARIAGLLHCALGAMPGSQISGETMGHAVTLARYLLAHAQATFGMMRADPHGKQADLLVRWIVRKELTAFSRRDAYRENPSHFERVEDCAAAIAVLVERGVVAERVLIKRTAGRPPTPVYEVNPATHLQNSQNRQNPDPPEETPGNEYSRNSDNIPTTDSQYSTTPLEEPIHEEEPPNDSGRDPWLEEGDDSAY